MKSIKNIAKALTGFAFIVTLCSQPVKAGEWTTVKGAVSTKNPHALVTVESDAEISSRLSVFGFIDAEATEEKPYDFKSLYCEGRVTLKFNNLVRAIAEYNGGNNYEDTIRLGIAVTPKLGKDNFTFIKLIPYETTEKKGPQASLFTLQNLTDRLSASILADYNLDSKTLYLEPTLDYKLGNNLSAFIQGRSFGKVGEFDFVPYVGISKSF